MRDWRRVSDEVFYTDSSITLVDQQGLEFLKAQAQSNPRQRCRLCGHPDPAAALHDMIIVMSGAAYIRPHKHLDKDETLHLIEGDGVLCVFDENGEIEDLRRLGGVESGANFLYRMPAGVYHTQLIRSDWLVFHESASGPFDATQMVEASWAPTEDDTEAVSAYRKKLFDRVNSDRNCFPQNID